MMTVKQALETENMEFVIKKMERYALAQLKATRIKDFNGKQPADFVGDVILKVAEGIRKWDSSKLSFADFLFGCLKSEISNFFTSRRVRHTADLPENMSAVRSRKDIAGERSEVSELLEGAGANSEELIVFECWLDGMTKPSEIARDLGIPVETVYKIGDRLRIRLSKVRTKLV